MLTGQYAANFVQGLQGLQSEYPAAKSHGPIDSKDGHMMIVACCKHFLANSLESWNGHTRHNFDAQVPLNDLADYYLPSFKACVMEGKSRGIMCSYNAVNSVPMW
jgi:beta-glucosidase-like glycosyl hydrolase